MPLGHGRTDSDPETGSGGGIRMAGLGQQEMLDVRAS